MNNNTLTCEQVIQEFTNKVTKGFSPGDFVWAVKENLKEVVCPLCKGEGKVLVTINGSPRRISCPDCINGSKFEMRYEVQKTVVQEIKLTLCFTKDVIAYWNFKNIFLRGEKENTPADMVFKTKEEAEIKARELNKANLSRDGEEDKP